MTETSEIILNNPTTGRALWSDISLLKEGKINRIWRGRFCMYKM